VTPRGPRPDRRLATIAAGVGLVIAALAQWWTPLSHPPLYDGVVVVDPYRYLAPAAGQPGHPGAATATLRISRGHVPLAAVSTPESPPQAQIFAPDDAFVVPGGSTDVRISIVPVPPPGQPPVGHIAGNVYRVSVTNQAGVALRALAKAQVSIILRAPAGTKDPRLDRWTGTAWEATHSSSETQSMYLAIVTEFGDFAMIAAGPAPSPSALATPASPGVVATAAPTPSPVPSSASGSDASSATIVVAVLVVALAVLVLWHRRSIRAGSTRR